MSREDEAEKEAQATKKRENERILREATELDEQEKRDARSFIPNVRITNYLAGDFFCYDKVEVPVRFIESIKISSFGHVPFMSHAYMTSSYLKSGRAAIDIVKSSGKVEQISCSRHEVDILHEALNKVWKHGKAKKIKTDE